MDEKTLYQLPDQWNQFRLIYAGNNHLDLRNWLFSPDLLLGTNTLPVDCNRESKENNLAPYILDPSIFGSYLLFIYGVLRNDFAIIFGQFIAYYIYLWNLNMQGIWKQIHVGLKAILLLTPVIAVALLMRDMNAFTTLFFRQKDIPVWLLIFGSAGQVLFTFRFIYQWIYSAHLHRSVLPIGFWIISLLGSGIIVAYGIIRHDPVLILGQSVGFVAYVRNIMIGLQTKTNVPI